MSVWCAVILCGVAVLLLILLILAAVWKKRAEKKVLAMSVCERVRLLNKLAGPFGFYYLKEDDIFTSRTDAWQRKRGYEARYDSMAVGAGMVLDAFPVYFDYQGKTWLIEFWKGQYGICTGGEVGVYHAEEIIPPHAYRKAHFDAVADEEMPEICTRLERAGKNPGIIYELCDRHWWLTGFCAGCWEKPTELRLLAVLEFPEPAMAQAFLNGLHRSGKQQDQCRICGRKVFVHMDTSPVQTLPAGLHRRMILQWNHILCWLYRVATRPMKQTADRFLLLYYLLPGCFGRLLCCMGDPLGRHPGRPRHWRACRNIRRG